MQRYRIAWSIRKKSMQVLDARLMVHAREKSSRHARTDLALVGDLFPSTLMEKPLVTGRRFQSTHDWSPSSRRLSAEPVHSNWIWTWRWGSRSKVSAAYQARIRTSSGAMAWREHRNVLGSLRSWGTTSVKPRLKDISSFAVVADTRLAPWICRPSMESGPRL